MAIFAADLDKKYPQRLPHDQALIEMNVDAERAKPAPQRLHGCKKNSYGKKGITKDLGSRARLTGLPGMPNTSA